MWSPSRGWFLVILCVLNGNNNNNREVSKVSCPSKKLHPPRRETREERSTTTATSRSSQAGTLIIIFIYVCTDRYWWCCCSTLWSNPFLWAENVASRLLPRSITREIERVFLSPPYNSLMTAPWMGIFFYCSLLCSTLHIQKAAFYGQKGDGQVN